MQQNENAISLICLYTGAPVVGTPILGTHYIVSCDAEVCGAERESALHCSADHMAVRLKLLYSNQRHEQSVNVITLRKKSENTNDTFVRTVRYSIVASTLRPCGLCTVVACRVVVCRVVVV